MTTSKLNTNQVEWELEIHHLHHSLPFLLISIPLFCLFLHTLSTTLCNISISSFSRISPLSYYFIFSILFFSLSLSISTSNSDELYHANLMVIWVSSDFYLENSRVRTWIEHWYRLKKKPGSLHSKSQWVSFFVFVNFLCKLKSKWKREEWNERKRRPEFYCFQGRIPLIPLWSNSFRCLSTKLITSLLSLDYSLSLSSSHSLNYLYSRSRHCQPLTSSITDRTWSGVTRIISIRESFSLSPLFHSSFLSFFVSSLCPYLSRPQVPLGFAFSPSSIDKTIRSRWKKRSFSDDWLTLGQEKRGSRKRRRGTEWNLNGNC